MKRIGKLKTRDYGDLLMVEHIDGKPHSVVTTEGTYDFNVSKKWGPLYHWSGSASCYLHPCGAGPRSAPLMEVWIADGVEVTDGSLADKVLSANEIRAMGYRIKRAPRGDPFKDARESEGHIVWCDACEDYMPDTVLCEHLGHVPGVCAVGPGNLSETRYQVSEQDMMLPVVEMVARAGIARQWRRLIAEGALEWKYGHLGTIYTGDVEGVCRSDIADEFVGEFAWVWFRGLDENTPEANRLTLEWLDLVIACQNERRRSGAQVYRLKAYSNLESRWYSWSDALQQARERRAAGERVRIVYVRRRSA